MFLFRVFLLCAACTAGVRQKSVNMDAISNSKPYNVKLLVTRHALTCTNIAQHWISTWDAGRAWIHDPLLSGAGETGSQQASKEVTTWLKANDLKVDAVLSSVLARSMQTALIMYEWKANPLHVVPFIRETGMGLSNAPKPQSEQPAHLQAVIQKQFELDYHWMEEFGSRVGTWQEFEHFLEQFFLPDLIEKSGKPPGSTIVLPLVTHSNFMKEGRINDKCKGAWENRGEKKARNNQVLNMEYTFEFAANKQRNISSANITDSEPSFFVKGSTYGEGELNGAWMQVGEYKNRPEYKKAFNKDLKVQYSESRRSWRMFIDNSVGKGRKSLFESKVDSETMPTDGWEPATEDGMSGKLKGVFGMEKADTDFGSIPQIVLRSARYRLKEAAQIPCQEVAAGQSLKNDTGKLAKYLCNRDIGEVCFQGIRDHSWCSGCLQSAEEVLAQAKLAYDSAVTTYQREEDSFETALKGLQLAAELPTETFTTSEGVASVRSALAMDQEESHIQSLSSHIGSMKKVKKTIQAKHAIIDELSKHVCLSGGNPDP